MGRKVTRKRPEVPTLRVRNTKNKIYEFMLREQTVNKLPVTSVGYYLRLNKTTGVLRIKVITASDREDTIHALIALTQYPRHLRPGSGLAAHLWSLGVKEMTGEWDEAKREFTFVPVLVDSGVEG